MKSDSETNKDDSGSQRHEANTSRETSSSAPRALEKIGIFRTYDTKMAGHYWRVVVHRNGQVFQKSFFEGHYGGRQETLKLAQAWRDVVISENRPISMAEFCSILRTNNTSGVTGVYRTVNRQSSRVGTLFVPTRQSLRQRTGGQPGKVVLVSVSARRTTVG